MTSVTTPSGLEYEDISVGSGATAKRGTTVSVHYTGWLTSGDKFDSSKDRNEPFSFPVGVQYVIAGWDEGVQGMQVGGVRRLTIPPNLGLRRTRRRRRNSAERDARVRGGIDRGQRVAKSTGRTHAPARRCRF